MPVITEPIITDKTGKELVAAIENTEVVKQRVAEINDAANEIYNEIIAKLPPDYSEVLEIVSRIREDARVGVVRVGSTKKEINDIIGENDIIIFQPASYELPVSKYAEAILKLDGKTVYGYGATIKIMANSTVEYYAVRCSNSAIYGLTVDGNNQNHDNTKHSEWAHNFYVEGNCTIKDCVSINAVGDGLMIINKGNTIKNTSITNSGRSGISVCGAQNLTISNCLIEEGTLWDPKKGINFEPDASNMDNDNIVVRNCNIKKLSICKTHIKNNENLNMKFDNCQIRNGTTIFELPNKGLPTISFTNCNFENSTSSDIAFETLGDGQCRFIIDNCVFNGRPESHNESAVSCAIRNSDKNYPLKNFIIRNCIFNGTGEYPYYAPISVGNKPNFDIVVSGITDLSKCVIKNIIVETASVVGNATMYNNNFAVTGSWHNQIATDRNLRYNVTLFDDGMVLQNGQKITIRNLNSADNITVKCNVEIKNLTGESGGSIFLRPFSGFTIEKYNDIIVCTSTFGDINPQSAETANEESGE